MHEASYYLNIIANNSNNEQSAVVDKLKAYAKELSPSMKHYEAYQRMNENSVDIFLTKYIIFMLIKLPWNFKLLKILSNPASFLLI